MTKKTNCHEALLPPKIELEKVKSFDILGYKKSISFFILED